MAYYVFNRIHDSIKKKDDIEIANKRGKKLLPEDLQSVLSKFKSKQKQQNESTDIQTILSNINYTAQHLTNPMASIPNSINSFTLPSLNKSRENKKQANAYQS